MADPIRVGIVGANPERGWANQSHLPGLTVLQEFQLTAVATTRAASAAETAKQFGVPLAFGDGYDLIASDAVDLVAVVVKVPHHYEYLKGAIAAGKHVYSEWPLAANLEQATELAALANAAGVRHVVGLQGRKSPMIRYARDLVKAGYVGQVLSAALTVSGTGRGGPVVAEDRVWAADKANGATTLTITAGHNIDALRYIVGEPTEINAVVATRYPVATVSGTGASLAVSAPDVILVQGLLRDGGFVSINVQSGLPKGTGAVLEIQGTDGALLVSGRGSLHLSDDTMVLRGASKDGAIEPLVVPAEYDVVPKAVPVGPARNIAALYLALASAINDGIVPDPSFDTAVTMHQLIASIEQAADSPRLTR